MVRGFDKVESKPSTRSRPRITLLRIPARTGVCAAATLPTGPHPPVQFVKINGSGERQQPGRDEVFAAPGAAREPGTGKDAGALYADVVAALRRLAEIIN
jgi:hypothetical protein